MSKTHWVAIGQVLLTAAQLVGVIDESTAKAFEYLVGAAFAGTLVHRGAKIVGGTAQP